MSCIDMTVQVEQWLQYDLINLVLLKIHCRLWGKLLYKLIDDLFLLPNRKKSDFMNMQNVAP